MTKEEKMTIWDKLLNIPMWVISVANIVLILIPILFPLALPVPIATPARRYFEELEKLTSESKIVFFSESSGSGWDEIKGGVLATLKYLWMKKIKMVLIAITPDAVPPLLWALDTANPKRFGVEYGKDYVFLGYIPGVEAMVAAVAADLHAAATTDVYGTLIKDIELTKGIKNYKDFQMLISYQGSATDMEKFVRQWQVPYPEVTNLWGTPAGNEAAVVPYMGAGIVMGYISGPTGSAALELLTHEPGPAAKITDIKNLASLPIIILVVIANIAFYGKKLSKGGR